MEIATDASFANKTTKFSTGQTIYVRVSTDNDGQDKHVLNLRDNNYNFITGYSMAKNGNQFLVNFPAPASSGIYSLEANIVSSGSVSNLVQTIEVGPSTGSGQVNVKINNQVNTGGQVAGEQATDSDNSESDDPVSEHTDETGSLSAADGFFASIWSKIREFFRGIF